MRVSIGQFSSAGRKPHNQDFHGAVVPRLPQLAVKGVTLAIADGISSSEVSQVASETAVKTFLEDYYCTSEAWSVRNAGTRVIAAIDSWLDTQTRAGPYRFERDRGYVCTFSALVLRGRMAHLFHIGDTRIYRLQDGALEQLTSDHRQWRSAGESYLSRALGSRHRDEPDYRNLPLQQGQCYLLTTDGVHEYVPAGVIIDLLDDPQLDLDTAARAIGRAALEHGSNDNLTVQVVRIDELPGQETTALRRAADRLPLPPALRAGSELDGYLIQRELHATARSRAYLATDSASGTRVFLKVPATESGGDAAYLERFLAEEWIARRVSNTHLLGAAPIDRERHYLYTTSEYIDGQPLSQWLRDHPQPDLETVRDIVGQVGRGLQALHRMEMLHRDLKPDNIMIDRAGTVKIIDYGAVRIGGLEELAGASGGDELLGTALYSAPECLLGQAPSPRSDLFSLGVLAYHLLSGEFPYGPRMARARTISAQRRLGYRSLVRTDRELPAWVDAAIRRAVHPDPHRRYDQLSEFLYDLRHPNPAYLSAERPPLIERNPVAFWRGLALLQFLALITMFYLLTDTT
ncbi:serine/threonine protein kinase [Microbulbifer yueqingensis]|uniref:Serine/threonine protein kinase n=1 Tax=Microbulbifer yueqingensis TaxID=658219 RepID=A0A1G9DNQ4_9GAMM|nr:serine/threonine protein kinase [Microbulbifer yueqingensis]